MSIRTGKNRRRQCPFCEFSAGKDSRLAKHLQATHSKTLEQAYIETVCAGTRPTCRCGCGCAVAFNKWNDGFNTFVFGHQARIWSAYGEEKARGISERRSAKLRGRIGWSRGKTKGTCPSLARAAVTRAETTKRQYESGERRAWSKGLTKETDQRLAASAQKAHEAFESGERVAWHKGKTSKTDARIAKKTNALIERYEDGELEPWAKGLTKDTDPRVASMLEKRNESSFYAMLRLPIEEVRRRLSLNTAMTYCGSDLETNYQGSNKKTLLVRCNKCDRTETMSLCQAAVARCPVCDPMGSKAEIEIEGFVRSLGFDPIRNDRVTIAPLELDICVPKAKVAIEHNGLYWHSELCDPDVVKNNKHELKRIAATKKGIRLIQFFEDEWINKRTICESLVSHALKVSPTQVDARKCDVRKVESKQARAFFDGTHMDGKANSKVSFGLFSGDELVGCISLREPFHRKFRHAGAIEVARMSFALGTSVRGGVGRLVSAAKKWAQAQGYKRLITYVDARFGAGEGYQHSGFQFEEMCAPRFWWTDGHRRINRFEIRADKARGLTQRMAAELAGVGRVAGCSNFRYGMAL